MDCLMDNTTLNVCKICLRKTEDNILLFSNCDESTDILNKIFSCFQITFTYNKLKPCTICFHCVNELDNCYNFRIKCLSVDERFNSYCNNLVELKMCKDEKCEDIEYSNHTDLNAFTEYPNNDIDEEKSGIPVDVKSEANDTSGFECTICNKVLKSKNSLLKHKVSMHEKRKHIGKVSGFGATRRYHCPSCPYSTPHSQTLVNHVRRHNGDRPYSCECGKSFSQASSLTAHRKIHSDATFFTCSYCGKQFKHAFAMKNHMRVHESGRLSCSICHKSLKSKQSLDAHMRRHYSIYNYNCEDCGDTFVTSSELQNHRKTHNVQKRLECHLCGHKTHAKKNLIVHLKRHAGNRTFKCDMCNVAFYAKSDLLKHTRVHTREKPFSCPACAHRYKYSPSLNKHMKTVHSVDYKWADLKSKETKVVKLTVKTEEKTNV